MGGCRGDDFGGLEGDGSVSAAVLCGSCAADVSAACGDCAALDDGDVAAVTAGIVEDVGGGEAFGFEALAFFAPLPRLRRKLETLNDVGLGYVKLGQPSTQLSGGEAQRVKLATELSRRDTGKTLYVLDEPTTGLHTDDVKRLLEILQRLCDSGSTVLVIEHNLDVIKTADHIIDLGPEGGDGGGAIVVTGTPEEVARCEASYTGQFLRNVLG